MSYTIFNKYKIHKSRVPKCYAMTANLRLKSPTCRAYIFKRLLSYVFNQINNFIMVLIETVGQKNKNPRLRDLAAKNSRIRDAKKHKKTRFRDWNQNFRDPEFRIPFATRVNGLKERPLVFRGGVGKNKTAEK